MFQEVLLRGALGRIIVLAPVVGRIEIEERFRPGKGSDLILARLVFGKHPKPGVGVKSTCESFPGESSGDSPEACSSESP
jgi:hypothetical protein